MRLGPRAARWLLVAGLLGGALGWWLPWVLSYRGAAALVLLGLDLGDFWKFTNEWRELGLLRWERLAFFLPPPLAAMGLALGIAGARGRARWLGLPLAAFLSFVILPAYEDVRLAFQGTPLAYDDPRLAREFTFQLRLALLSGLGVALVPLWQRLDGRLRGALLVAVTGAGALLPAWALWRTWPLLQGLYGGGARVGPGVALTVGGFLVALLASLHLLARAIAGHTFNDESHSTERRAR